MLSEIHHYYFGLLLMFFFSCHEGVYKGIKKKTGKGLEMSEIIITEMPSCVGVGVDVLSTSVAVAEILDVQDDLITERSAIIISELRRYKLKSPHKVI